jgi:hypothetical protein
MDFHSVVLYWTHHHHHHHHRRRRRRLEAGEKLDSGSEFKLILAC